MLVRRFFGIDSENNARSAFKASARFIHIAGFVLLRFTKCYTLTQPHCCP